MIFIPADNPNVKLTRRGTILAHLAAYVITVAAVVYGIPAVLRMAIAVHTLTGQAVDYLTPAAPVLVPLLLAGPAWLALLVRDARTPR